MLPLALALAQTLQLPILLDIDATEAPRGVLRVKETFPDAKGRVRVSLPKWIPGEHMASGTINALVHLHFFADGRELAWTRDSKETFAFRVDVPSGGTLRAKFVVVSNLGDNLGPKLGRIKWNRLVLLPEGDVSRLIVRASIQAPAGWKVQTALLPTPTESRTEFAPVSAERLVDSPAQIGAYARTTELEPGYWPDLVTDEPAQLDLRPGMVDSFRALVVQTRRLFGARHFGQYRFLCNVSDRIATEGLEHHESAEDGMTSALRQGPFGLGDLVSHELFHSWNGKHRRPKGLATRDFEAPYDTELLWVYEGLTRYFEHPLAVRAGFNTPEEARERLAAFLARECAQPGRAWRSVADTALSIGAIAQSDPDWMFDRRRLDYYEEACFVWMEIDATLRRLTQGRRSLDDFCHAFAGGRDTGPEVRPYVFKDVVRTLNGVAPYDWEALLRSRLYDVHPAPPTEGIEAVGWRLVYGSKPNSYLSVAMLPAGFTVAPDGKIVTVALDTPAYRAGVRAGTKIVTVNGRPYRPDAFGEEVGKKGSIRLDLDADGVVSTANVDYRSGLAYPHLERIEGTPDLLSAIFKPL